MRRAVYAVVVGVTLLAGSAWGLSALQAQTDYHNTHECHYVWVPADGTQQQYGDRPGYAERMACPGSPTFNNPSSR